MKIARTLPPVGYRFPVGELVRAIVPAAARREGVLQLDLAQRFQVHTALAVSSGKAALTLALLALAKLTGRRKVIVPAYTCYSVPSAIVKADLDIAPCDLAEGSFDYDYAHLVPMLQRDVLCVISVHLFGIPSNTARLIELCHTRGIFVVEDAAQALGGVHRGRHVGTVGDVGVFSFGRGKNLTCGSGGLIVTSSDQIAAALTEVTSHLPRTRLVDDAVTLAALLALSWFIAPRLYWIPAGLPFLRLGETIFHDDFPVRWLSDFQSRLLRGWHERLRELESVRMAHTRYYHSHLDVIGVTSSDVAHRRQPAWLADAFPLLRFPVLVERGQKHRLLFAQGGVALGMSPMYPATIAAIPQLAGRLEHTSFPQAESIAESLVTLPTHPLVTESDRARICTLVNAVSRRCQDARQAS